MNQYRCTHAADYPAGTPEHTEPRLRRGQFVLAKDEGAALAEARKHWPDAKDIHVELWAKNIEVAWAGPAPRVAGTVQRDILNLLLDRPSLTRTVLVLLPGGDYLHCSVEIDSEDRLIIQVLED